MFSKRGEANNSLILIIGVLLSYESTNIELQLK